MLCNPTTYMHTYIHTCSDSPGSIQDEFLRVKSETDAAERERALMLASLPPEDPEKHAIEGGLLLYYIHTYIDT